MPESWSLWFSAHPLAATLTGLVVLVLVAALVDQIARRVLLRAFVHMAQRTKTYFDNALVLHNVPHRLAHMVPAAVLQLGIEFVPGVPVDFDTLVRNVAMGFMILMAMLALSGLLGAVNEVYQRDPARRHRSIKGYLQLAKLAVYIVGSILIVAVLIERSPLLLFTGLGAMGAVLLLIFKDTLLSLVASVQLASNDIIRVGDWVELPGLGVDGDVIDIALHTVKVRNWDRTISTIPTSRFIADAIKNWRGMSESGGRRIKRPLHIDLQSVRFLDTDEIHGLERFRLLRDYLASKREEIQGYNEALGDDGGLPVNARRLTNLGTFRAYVLAYLRAHPRMRADDILMVRQLEPTACGLPLEIYGFTATTAWVDYEGIQADIFDHLIAIAPEFGLRIYQEPSGQDLRVGLDRA